MKQKLHQAGALAALSALLLATSLQAALVHRYSFNETSGTTVDDSVGTADGVIKGTGAAFTGAGTLELPGGGASGDAADIIAGYVDLPNRLISVLSELTIESWVTWRGSGSWQRIFDLGTSAGGEDVVNGNGNYLFLSPQGDVNLRFAVRDPVTGGEPTQLTAPFRLDIDSEVLVTVTYNPAANVARLFTNGVLVVTGTATVPLNSINDVNNWLGRSQWNDAMFYGAYNEFRIYDNAMNPLEVAASYLSGSATPSTDPALLGAVQGVHLTVVKTTLTQDDEQGSAATVDFAQAAGVSLAGVTGVTYQSSALAVATVSATGLIKAVSAGTADITVSYSGQTDTVAITVIPRLTGVMVAGTLFVDLRATELSGDRATWPNKTGLGDFFAEGAPGYSANVDNTGVAGVLLNGADAYSGPLTTPELEGASDRSIEVWAYNPYVSQDETLVSWGHRGGGPDSSNMAFGYGANGAYGAAGHWGNADMGWGESVRPLPGRWHYLVYTYDGSIGSVYSDGVLKYSDPLSPVLATHPGGQIRIGAQGNTAGDATDFGQALSGAIARVRVHTGALSANDVKNNFLYGVELTAPGDLQTVNLTLDTNVLYGAGTKAFCKVLAGYASRNYLSVNEQCTFSSSDPAVATIDPVTGVITAQGLGTTTITARYAGTDGTQSLQVVAAPPYQLVHRYSFSEAPGSTTVNDSAGTAHGVIKGAGAVFDGAGKLTLPGGTSSAADAATISGYVDLPNGIISILTDATFETWVSWNGAADSSWQRIFDLGRSDGGEDVSNGYGDYLYASPRNGANAGARFAFRDVATGAEPVVLDWTQPQPIGSEVHMTVVYDQRHNASRFYSNAVQVATGPAPVALKTISDVNNWLGRSQWGDPMFSGTYNEFRIWDGALSATEVSASYVAGPDTLPIVTAPPLIGIEKVPAGVTISWPSSATGFLLESAITLPATPWTAVDTSGAVDQGGQKRLTLPIEGTSKYYRMKK